MSFSSEKKRYLVPFKKSANSKCVIARARVYAPKLLGKRVWAKAEIF